MSISTISTESIATKSLSTNDSEKKSSPVYNIGQKVECLVVDSGPLIKGTNVRSFAEKLYTVPEVISEIRDKHSRDFLNQISFDIQVKVPSDEALKEGSLSAVDLRVLALTYMLEVEANGTERLRKEPVKSRMQFGGYNKNSIKDSKMKSEEIRVNIDQQQIDESNLVSNLEQLQLQSNIAEVPSPERDESDLIMGVDELTLESSMSDTERNNTNCTKINDSDQTSIIQKTNETLEVRGRQVDYDDDDIGWITPDNIDKYQAKEQKFTINLKKDNENMKIACMTTDYSMQNILLQMRLNLISVDGKRIRKVKNWVLRCHACYKVTTNMEKQFCPKCGNATLIRTSTSTDANGNVTYYLKKNFQYNLRGSKYSIPDPKSGRHANNLILREDQKEYQKALKNQRRQKEIDIFDPDYIPRLLIGSNLSKSNTPVIGYGRRNPNEARRGKNKGRKK
ncbi:2627_t:CDS:2 [Funneliformis geosporum]|uniref:20S-pre-rRNA D-site endonuclease NOB1 n=1 Tax=Funneliformis geosporum TaxID=1117311 RepID=A0A9W4WL48_9GLOM|nr:18547_t:CDS:2 [Funneliformis geosporum]CAI2171096.1 2627_t:CDS:2 [Funneliformis geosporum]